jgi:hypothetical protein
MKLNPKQFVMQSDGVFLELLSEHGFVVDGYDKEDDWHVCRRYRSGDRYIEITADCHFRDGKPECALILGHGSHEWPETDWNKIALWRSRGEGENYPFNTTSEIPDILHRMSIDLTKLAADFLANDLSEFTMARANQNRDRQPYIIHSPQPDGSYRSTIDPESEQLKRRFS